MSKPGPMMKSIMRHPAPGPMMRHVMFLRAQDEAMARLTNHLSRSRKAGAGRTKRRKKYIHPMKDT